jgi:hypothetical protein
VHYWSDSAVLQDYRAKLQCEITFSVMWLCTIAMGLRCKLLINLLLLFRCCFVSGQRKKSEDWLCMLHEKLKMGRSASISDQPHPRGIGYLWHRLRLQSHIQPNSWDPSIPMLQSIPLNLKSCPLVCTCSFKTFSLEKLSQANLYFRSFCFQWLFWVNWK